MRNTIKLLLGLVLATSTLTFAAGGPALAKKVNSWQATDTENIPTGTSDFFEHQDCPSGYSAQNGGFMVLTTPTLGNGFLVTANAPRLDLSPPQYNEWAWNFVWPSGGAPAGSQIIFDVNCVKGGA
ncbi:MAG TPA: hypothetical protein VHU23_19445 [Rhizomicrobium sp.]|jgi:hypothetical protein|nr:hypothetical protein [Rhizomicrobium sp.]